MSADDNAAKKKWPVKRTIFFSFLIILLTAAFLLYNNFNRILSERLMAGFNSTIISDVYELKFEKLRVDVFEGSIRMFDVVMQPREKPLHDYPYINSSFRLTTERITLKNVSFLALLKSKEINLERISIRKPDIEISMNGKRHILFPFSDSTTVDNPTTENRKKPIASFVLNEFQLIDAAIHTTNSVKQREFRIKNFNISLYHLLLNQSPGKYVTSFKQVKVSVGEFAGDLKKDALKHVGVNDFTIGMDSLAIRFTLDTLIYRFHDFTTGLHDLDIQTADSLFHVSVQSFDLSYQSKSIQLKAVSFRPNVSHAVLQKKYKFQHTEFSGSVGKLDLVHVDFDSLIYAKKLFIDEVVLDHVTTAIFKDKTKSIDKNRMPVYLGQTIRAIPLPLRIKRVKATHVSLANTERKPDSTYAKVNITKATLTVDNITNLAPHSKLVMSADAYIEDKAHFKASLTFHYQKPQFDFEALVEKFNLPDLNPLIQSYTPAKINKGISNEISIAGVAEETKASGTMKFLYHDLEIDLELHEKAKWKSSVIAFAANTALNSSNPGSTHLPPRIVTFKMERDMNKGFVNVIIKSVLNGLKETMIMSKENRKAYKQSKKELRQQNKK